MVVVSEKEIKPLQCKALPSVIQDRRGAEIHIRAYQDKDYQAIMTMYDHFEPKGMAMGLPPPDAELRRDWIDYIIKTFFNIIALHQKRIVGHAVLDIFRTKVSPEYLIFLHQDFRNLGIGTKLTLIVKQVCKELGCRQVWVSVSSHNTRAIKIFKKVGFKFRGPIGSEREMVLDLRLKQKKRK